MLIFIVTAEWNGAHYSAVSGMKQNRYFTPSIYAPICSDPRTRGRETGRKELHQIKSLSYQTVDEMENFFSSSESVSFPARDFSFAACVLLEINYLRRKKYVERNFKLDATNRISCVTSELHFICDSLIAATHSLVRRTRNQGEGICYTWCTLVYSSMCADTTRSCIWFFTSPFRASFRSVGRTESFPSARTNTHTPRIAKVILVSAHARKNKRSNSICG